MKKTLILLITFCFIKTWAQTPQKINRSNEWESFSIFGFELLGDEGLYSINYEGRFYNNNYHALTCRFGIEIIPRQILPMAGVNYLFGKQKIHLQCGAHAIYNIGLGPNNSNDFFTSFSVGPRFRLAKTMFIGLKYNYLFFPLKVYESRNWFGLTWTFPLHEI